MSSFEKRLASLNDQTLYRQVTAGMTVEVVDMNLTPVVRVSAGSKKAEFPLEKLGLFYADGTDKFYSEASGDEVSASELNDLAVEAFLFGGPKGAE